MARADMEAASTVPLGTGTTGQTWLHAGGGGHRRQKRAAGRDSASFIIELRAASDVRATAGPSQVSINAGEDPGASRRR